MKGHYYMAFLYGGLGGLEVAVAPRAPAWDLEIIQMLYLLH